MKRFIEDRHSKYDEFTLGLKAGFIDKDGCICNAQIGALDTFSVGMPVYTDGGSEIGRLSVGLFKNLNYATDGFDMDIPVEFWRVDGYRGEPQSIKTYWQVRHLAQPLKEER